MRGRFITFEGLDGSGKSTQMERLAADLRRSGRDVVTTREPGGTSVGEKIRSVVLGQGPAPLAELALMAASRAQSVAEVIRPALDAGRWVLCDRFHDATEAYQGGGRGLDRTAIRDLHRLLCADLQPDLTLIFDLDPVVSLERARKLPAAGRFEAESMAFFGRVARTYREIAAREPQRCRLIAAEGSMDEVAARVSEAANVE
ncbi:MAG TPA: dTMP kinase [Terriglobales bacterium]|jgi:dTMP kinase